MRARSSPKRPTLDLIRRPEGGAGGTGPLVVPPGGPPLAKRDIVATVHELVDALIALTTSDQVPAVGPVSNMPLLLNAVEAGRLLSISRSKVLDLAARGQLPSLRVGGSVRIPRDLLTAWVVENTRATNSTSGMQLPAWVRVDRSNER